MTEAKPEEAEIEEERGAPMPRETVEEEKPLFDLGDLLKARMKKGETPSFIEALMFMQYLDNKEERLWRRQQAELNVKQQKNPNPEVEALKAEVSELRKKVSELLETIQDQQQQEAQKQFIEGVVKQTTEKIMPELQAVKEKLAEYDKLLASGQKPEISLSELKETLKETLDKIGEKVGASGRTLSDYANDVEKILGLFDSIQKRMKTGEAAGEVDYRTMLVSTLGELGKEAIGAYKDISTTRTGAAQPPLQPETPAAAMQSIIKRQVQNYILNRMEAGATTINVQQAAQELGLTPGQVYWAYNELMKEGWFHVRIPGKGEQKEAAFKAEETGSQSQTEGEQVFEPPA